MREIGSYILVTLEAPPLYDSGVSFELSDGSMSIMKHPTPRCKSMQLVRMPGQYSVHHEGGAMITGQGRRDD